MIPYIKQLSKALIYSIEGLKYALHQKAFQLEIIASIILIPIASLSDKPIIEKAMLVYSLFLILIVELINSAIEKTVDRISTDKHTLSKQAKDIASCAVFFSIINFVIIWSIIFIKPLLD